MKLAASKALVCTLSLAALVVLAATAHADPVKCQRSILKESGKFAQAKIKALSKCNEAQLKGKTGSCPDSKTSESISKAADKLRSGVEKACGGPDQDCGTVGDNDSLASIGWPSVCPGFEGGCTNLIGQCDDISTCLECVNEKAIDQAISLYYDYTLPSSPGTQLNKCQIAIGKATSAFFQSKTKALDKCWDAKLNGNVTVVSCVPPATGDGKYLAAITKAETKKIDSITKDCTGVSVASIAFVSSCPAVTVPGGPACGGPITDLDSLITCVDCVTEFKVDCEVSLAVPGVQPYPPQCPSVLPTPIATPTVMATPTLTAPPTPIATVTPCGAPGTCGNCVIDPGEFCDGPALGGACGLDFTCTGCNCACPTKVSFTGDATAPESILDTGWTGISHRAPIVTDGTASLTLSGCAGSSRPCGVCNVTGPVANPNAGAGEIDNRRCTNNNAKRCTSSASCGQQCYAGEREGAACTYDSKCPGGSCAAAGTCEFFFGSDLPLAAGGVTVCVVNQFNGPVSGTSNIESGDASTVANLTARVYTGIAIDNPCARCVGDPAINDGVLGGTCDGGVRVGLTCDGNGTAFNRPDFGTTSLDCPLAAGALIATLPIDFSNTTGPVTKTLSASSPTCQGAPGERCLCDTCNNVNQEPCGASADCPISGGNPGICGGRRCLGGTNAGAPCAATSACPGLGICGRPGAAAAPSACLDDIATPDVLDCSDTSPVDGEGECIQGPLDTTCSVASGHAQRGCFGDVDCGGGVGSCVSTNRPCFLTGGLTGRNGTNTLTAVGMADPPMNDTSNPTIAAVFCVGPTGASAVNSVSGLPGPGRTTIKGAALLRP